MLKPQEMGDFVSSVTLHVKVGGRLDRIVVPLDGGLTDERRTLIAELLSLAARPADTLTAGPQGITLTWADGQSVTLQPLAWATWWRGRRPVCGLHARRAADAFTAHLWGHVVGPGLVAAIAAKKLTLWEAIRDFPGVLLSPQIQELVYQSIEAGTPVGPARGERRKRALDDRLRAVCQVEELRSDCKAKSVLAACEEVAKRTSRASHVHDAADAIRKQYERGPKWYRVFEPPARRVVGQRRQRGKAR